MLRAETLHEDPTLRAGHRSRLDESFAELVNGSLCAWRSDVVRDVMAGALSRARGRQRRRPALFHSRKEGGLIGVDMMAIPADAPHPGNAEKWMNYLMRPEVMAAITNTVKYPNGNRASLPFVQDPIKNDPQIYPSPETRATLHAIPAMTPDQVRLVTRLWTRFRTGQ